MQHSEQLFAIHRHNGNKKFIFSYSELIDIPVGREGRKMLAFVESVKGSLGRFFLKALISKENGIEQVAKWQYLKKHGVRVPNLFKLIILADGTPSLVIHDLSENGRYLVVGLNNPEICTQKFEQISSRISPITRERMISDLVRACEAASGMYDNGDNPNGTIYAFQSNAFIMAINPTDPEDSVVYVADFGRDVMKRNTSYDDPNAVLKSNLRSAAIFYCGMTNEAFQLPNEHALASTLNPMFIDMD